MKVKKRPKRPVRDNVSSRRSRALPAPAGVTPTLSVCMIVKNEEQMLPACLESVCDITDELVIVDTGSTDRTVEIARSFGAVVHCHPWQNDFSLHRNQSVVYATGDWILQIDADERLTEKSRQKLRAVLGEMPGNVAGVMLTIRDFARGGELRSIWNYPRLFRNRAGVRYEGIVHNQVLIPGTLHFSDLTIDHFGYDLPAETMRRKFRRSVTLLRKLHRLKPDEAFAPYYLANIYSAYARHELALSWGEKALERLRRLEHAPPHYLSVYFTMIASAVKLHRYQDAQRYCIEALRIYPRYLDAHYYLACLAFMARRFEEAAQYCGRYFAVRSYLLSNPAHCSTMMHYTLHRPQWMEYYFGFSLFTKNETATGLQHLLTAIRQPSTKPGMIVEMVHNVLALGQIDIARKLVEEALQAFASRAELLLLLSRELLEAGFFVWVEEVLENGLQVSAAAINSPLAVGLVKIICGRCEEAREILLRTAPSDQQYWLAMLLANQFEPDPIRSAVSWEEAVASLRLAGGNPATAFATAAWLIQQRRPDEVLSLRLAVHSDTENRALFQMQTVQAAAIANQIDRLLNVLNDLLANSSLSKPAKLDSLNDLANEFVRLSSAYKQKNWLDATTEAIRLAWWFDQSNAASQARYYAHLVQVNKRSGRLSALTRAAMREAIPRPSFQAKVFLSMAD